MSKLSDTYLFSITFTLALFASLVLTSSLNFSLVNSAIVIHVVLGGGAFLLGTITLFSKKGSSIHKSSGRLFYVSMVVSVALSLLVSLLPNHQSPSLFQIGVLSLYFLIGGKRSLLLKQQSSAPSINRLLTDQVLAFTVVLVSLVIMLYSVYVDGSFHPLRTVFGVVGIAFGGLDLWLFYDSEKLKRKWLFLHLSKMLGGYTAAVTAFMVAQDILGGYYNWFTPTVFALAYIVYWAFKLNVFQIPLQTKII
jgi:uncharacterized membrane protein